jgi:DNA-binding protein H-NS
MPIDLSTLSPRELQKLIDDASRERKRKEKRAPLATVRKKLTKMAVAEGYTLMELFGLPAAGRSPTKVAGPAAPRRGSTRRSTAGTKVAPKYRNPANPAETWSGRGKHPKWMTTAMAGGKKPEDFLI